MNAANTVSVDQARAITGTDAFDWSAYAPTAPIPYAGAPRLSLAPKREPRKRALSPLMAAVTAVTVILVTLCAQLVMSIAMSQAAYETRALQGELRDLNRVQEVITLQTQQLASPQHLAATAAQLGMVQNTTPATLRLSDGEILGALGGATAEVAANRVPNATIEEQTAVSADQLLHAPKPTVAVGVDAGAAIPWSGLLPAPQTH